MAGHVDFKNLHEGTDLKKNKEEVKKELLFLIKKYNSKKEAGTFKKIIIEDCKIMELPQDYMDSPLPADKAYAIENYKDLVEDWDNAGIEVHVREINNEYFLVL